MVTEPLYDDADLRRIEQEGVLEPLASRAGELAAARTAEAAGRAVEALKDVMWSALRGELAHSEPELAAGRCRTALVGDGAGSGRCPAPL